MSDDETDFGEELLRVAGKLKIGTEDGQLWEDHQALRHPETQEWQIQADRAHHDRSKQLSAGRLYLFTKVPKRVAIPDEDLKVLEAIYHNLIPYTSRSKGSLTRIINNYRKHFPEDKRTRRLLTRLEARIVNP